LCLRRNLLPYFKSFPELEPRKRWKEYYKDSKKPGAWLE
jgi:hypothetical protein